MSAIPSSSENPSSENAATPPQRNLLRRTLSPPNPFYLLSAACILHSTGLGLHEEGGLAPLMLMGLVGGYVLLMGAVAFCIVRLWNVWDDARSIMLLVMLLFVELALVADRPLMEDRSTGVLMLFAGLGIAIVVTELIFRGLRMRLPWLYRVPLYLLWSLLFLYPLALLGPLDAREFARLPWLLLLFPVLAGLGLLMLLPAVRRGRSAIAENGTPWKWPLYPWTIFVFLGLCLLFRSYALCLSFDPALDLTFAEAWGLQSIYGPYFAVPLLFALAWLVMESGICRRSRITQWIGLCLPVACVLLALPGRSGNAAYARFVAEIVETIGSPAWITLIAALAFYGVAALRGVRFAWRGALLCLLAFSVITPTTLAVSWPMPVTSWPLFAAAGVMVLLGAITWKSHWLWESVLYLTGGLAAEGLLQNDLFSTPHMGFYVLAAAMLVIGGLTRDQHSPLLRRLGALGLLLAAADMSLDTMSLHEVRWLPVMMLGVFCLLPLAVGWWRRDGFVRGAAAINGVQWYAGGLMQLFVVLIDTHRWSGWPSFAVGIVMLHLGIVVSGIKGGAHHRLLDRITGPASEPTPP